MRSYLAAVVVAVSFFHSVSKALVPARTGMMSGHLEVVDLKAQSAVVKINDAEREFLIEDPQVLEQLKARAGTRAVLEYAVKNEIDSVVPPQLKVHFRLTRVRVPSPAKAVCPSLEELRGVTDSLRFPADEKTIRSGATLVQVEQLFATMGSGNLKVLMQIAPQTYARLMPVVMPEMYSCLKQYVENGTPVTITYEQRGSSWVRILSIIPSEQTKSTMH